MLKNGQRAKKFILISMFNLITINLNYSCSFMYPVNVFQTSIKNFIVLIQGNWTIKKIALKFHSITNNILHILKRLHIYNAAI